MTPEYQSRMVISTVAPRMQAVGMVNDHQRTCFRHAEVRDDHARLRGREATVAPLRESPQLGRRADDEGQRQRQHHRRTRAAVIWTTTTKRCSMP